MDESMRAWLDQAGSRDPEGLLAAEADAAALARFAFLHLLRCDMTAAGEPFALGTALVAGEDAYYRLVNAGVDPDDLLALIRTVAAEAALACINLLEAGRDWDAPPDAPGWALVEVDEQGQPTGRRLEGLHEALFDLLERDRI